MRNRVVKAGHQIVICILRDLCLGEHRIESVETTFKHLVFHFGACSTESFHMPDRFVAKGVDAADKGADRGQAGEVHASGRSGVS